MNKKGKGKFATILITVIITIVISVGIGSFYGYKQYQKYQNLYGNYSNYPNYSDFEKYQNYSPEDFAKYGDYGDFGGFGGFSIFNPRKPACVSEQDSRAQVIYARPSDAPDRYSIIVPKLRGWIADANGIVNTEAQRFGKTADLKVVCEGEEVSVLNVALPLNSASKIDKQPLAAALREKGFTSDKAKYIVFWDGKMYGCGSEEAECTGTVWVNEVYEPGTKAVREILSDDKLYADSPFNKGGDFAFVVGVDDPMLAPIILLHEYAHTMGAVQLGAPNSAGEGHCKDEPPAEKGGNDIMCKSDISGTVFGDSCGGGKYGFEFRFDCNNDDYFNPSPAPGSYLATHWNVGSELNKFIKFGKA